MRAQCYIILHITRYPRLTRAYTPDASEEVRTIPFPPCGENCTMLAPSSFFLANPLRWALLGVREVGRAFRLDGLRHICASKAKNHSKIHRCQVQAVLPWQKGGQTTKRPQGILRVFPRSLRKYGRFSARQNRVCPCQPRVRKAEQKKLSKEWRKFCKHSRKLLCKMFHIPMVSQKAATAKQRC